MPGTRESTGQEKSRKTGLHGLQHFKDLVGARGFEPPQPEWIKAFHAWLTTHANTASWELGDPIPAEASGKVLYSIYFNVLHDGMRG